jgi:hypothetical protein
MVPIVQRRGLRIQEASSRIPVHDDGIVPSGAYEKPIRRRRDAWSNCYARLRMLEPVDRISDGRPGTMLFAATFIVIMRSSICAICNAWLHRFAALPAPMLARRR